VHQMPDVGTLRDATATDLQDARKRVRRWHSFQVIFAFLYLGIVLDLITTAMGFARTGSSYEQNPLGGALIHNTGWIGLFVALSVLAGVFYFSSRVVCLKAARFWSTILTGLLALAALVRWTAVVTAILYLVQTPH
jgi:hypothetical protein